MSTRDLQEIMLPPKTDFISVQWNVDQGAMVTMGDIIGILRYKEQRSEMLVELLGEVSEISELTLKAEIKGKVQLL